MGREGVMGREGSEWPRQVQVQEYTCSVSGTLTRLSSFWYCGTLRMYLPRSLIESWCVRKGGGRGEEDPEGDTTEVLHQYLQP